MDDERLSDVEKVMRINKHALDSKGQLKSFTEQYGEYALPRPTEDKQLRSDEEKEALESITELAEAHGWTVASVNLAQDPSYPYVELEGRAPNDMDALATIELDLGNPDGILGFGRGLVEYLASYDPEEECLMYFQPGSQLRGRPGLRAVLEDCEWAQDSLLEMHDSLCVTPREVVREAELAKGQEPEAKR